MAENGHIIPRFFKLFLSATDSESLLIPLSFMEYLDNPLPKTVKLQGIGGNFWTVSLTSIREAVYFTHGWPKFAEDHDLKNGEFLTFVYDGLRTFEVSVFDRWGCKETRAEIQAIQLSDSDSLEEEEEEQEEEEAQEEEQEEEEEEEQEEEEAEQETSMDVDDNSCGEDEEISQSIYPFDDEETETDAAVVAGSSNMELITNPHFLTTLKIRIYDLIIPAKVVKENHLTFGDSVRYIDEEGTLVGVRGKWSDDRICFKGWDRICRRNRIKKHDTVQCELLHDQKRVHSIRVHVMRGAA